MLRKLHDSHINPESEFRINTLPFLLPSVFVLLVLGFIAVKY